MKKLRICLVVGLLLSLVACTHLQPIENFSQQTIPKGLTNDEVQQAIAAAAGSTGWKAIKKSTGLIVASYSSRKGKLVKAEISFDKSTYNITYLSSEGINQQEGKIEPVYNSWIEKLNDNIQKQLEKVQNQKSD